MPVASGAHLGPYEILQPLGSGGMGEVYRARDTRLGRDVALKILSTTVTLDLDRLRRFEQEARATAALNHPNILTVHDVGADGGIHYVVSELLEGETLRDRLRVGPVPPRKAIDYAAQIARGLAAAHAKGIVHRDLKPENIFVTREGHAKILDFGLAKLVASEPVGGQQTSAPTVEAGTTPGLVLGTVGYMSPEQVRGLSADHRADVFSFGAILYEMLSGKRAFAGATQADTMSAILNAEPPELAEPSRAIPPILDRLVRRCLEKNADERFQSIRDVAFNLDALSTVSEGGVTETGKTARARLSKPARSAVAAILGLAVGAAAAVFVTRRAFQTEPPHFHQLTFRRGTIVEARFTPDRETVVYSAAWEGDPTGLFAARLGAVGERSLGIANAWISAISRNGEMALLTNPRSLSNWMSIGTLARAPLAGGAPREILRDVGGADWSPDGQQLAITRWLPAIRRWQLEYPIGAVLYEADRWLDRPRVSRHGDRVAFIEHPLTGDDRGTIAVVGAARDKQTLTKEFASTRGVAWSADDKEIWFTGSESGNRRDLFGVTLKGALRSILQAPSALHLEDVDASGRVLLHADAVKSRLLAKAPDAAEERELGWLDYPIARDISADGKLLLFDEEGEGGGPRYSVYVRSTDGAPAIRLGEGYAVGLSPDVQWALTTPVTPGARYTILPIGPGEPRVLDIVADKTVGFPRWFPDGKRLLVNDTLQGGAVRAYEYVFDSRKVRPLTPEGTRGLLVSPDNRTLLAEESDGRWALLPLDGGQPRAVLGHQPGDVAIGWVAGRQALFVAAAAAIPRVIVQLDLTTGRREPWKTMGPSDRAGVVRIGFFAVAPDGRAYAYRYNQILSDLFVSEGLR